MFAMIKNNMKLMFRNKMILVMMVGLPILVIAALSSAFHGLLNNEYKTDHFTVGYYFEENTPLAAGENEFVKAFEEQNITVENYAKNNVEEAITKGNVEVFLYCDQNKCEVAAGDTTSIQARVCEYVLQQFLDEYDLSIANMERVMVGEQAKEKVELKTESLPYTKTANAEDYYGMIEIIYFMWCGLIFLTAVVQSERSNHLQKRFVISPVSGIKLYFGKFIPCEIFAVVSATISACIATLLFDIHWGNLPGTIGILFLVSLASTALGILLLYLVKNLAASVILLFSIVWGWGFLGGSFETYMFASYPDALKRLSPLYYANRTIVEYSTMGHSDYTRGCILYMCGIFVVCFLIGAALMKHRMEEA